MCDNRQALSVQKNSIYEQQSKIIFYNQVLFKKADHTVLWSVFLLKIHCRQKNLYLLPEHGIFNYNENLIDIKTKIQTSRLLDNFTFFCMLLTIIIPLILI